MTKQLLLNDLKQNNEDFEWYPTTKKMIEVVHVDMHKKFSNRINILDVGAGDGNFLNILSKVQNEKFPNDFKNLYFTKYAIEKSKILLDKIDSDIYIVGTDFYQQTLIDKKMDVVFCNPPYKDYKNWALKIISECNCTYLYLIIPQRWDNEIKEMITKRKAEYEVLYSDSFIDSEFRKSRANVDIIRISYNYSSINPFNIWFENNFKIEADKAKYDFTAKSEEKLNTLVCNKNLIQKLVDFYNRDLEDLFKNYKALETLDKTIFNELNIDIDNLIEGLQIKIKGLKALYWQNLFNKLESIVNRLTEKNRDEILKTLSTQANIDFTESNIHAVVLWVIKNANTYIDEQLKDVYYRLSRTENVINYKSNMHFVKDKWRYCRRENQVNYYLDYRIVDEGSKAINNELYSDWNYHNNLSKKRLSDIQDIFTIAENIGFNIENNLYSREWQAGKEQVFYLKNGEIFAKIRAYLNGNIHYKMNKTFMKRFNIEAGRLNGWIKSPKHASNEMDIDIDFVKENINTNLKITKKSCLLLTA